MAEPKGDMMGMMDSSSQLRKLFYQPLKNEDTIRILILHPADGLEAPLVADLIHEDRDAAIHDDSGGKFWDAVSYTWGQNPPFSCTVRCNDCDLPITPNVDTLLRYLRKSHKTRRLWIDAICLNQKDSHEKKKQVQRMGEIYNEARKVVVWLGLDQDITIDEHTILPLSAVSTRLRRVKAHFRSTNFSPQDLSSADHILIRRFLELPWFQRRWTIQEVAVHSNVVLRLGMSKILWSEVKSALELLQEELKIHYMETDDVSLSLKRLFWTYSDYTGILDLLWRFDLAACGDASDRIAAFQGLRMLGNASVGKTVDYTLPWYSNYVQSTRSILLGLQSVSSPKEHQWKIWSHLIAFGNLSNTNSQMPSWVPDWRNSRQTRSLLKDLVIEYLEEGCSAHVPKYFVRHSFSSYSERIEHGIASKHYYLHEANALPALVSHVQKIKKAFPLLLECRNHLEELKNLFSRAPLWFLKALVVDSALAHYPPSIIFQSIIRKSEERFNTKSSHLLCHLAQISGWISNLISKRGLLSLFVDDLPLDGSQHVETRYYQCVRNVKFPGSAPTACQEGFIGQFIPQLCRMLKDQVFIIDDQERPGLASNGVVVDDWLLDYPAVVENGGGFAERLTTAPCVVVRKTTDKNLIPNDCHLPVARLVGVSLSLLVHYEWKSSGGFSGYMILV